MTKEEMVEGLKKRIVDLGLEGYVDMFNELIIEPKSTKFKLDPKIHESKINASSDKDDYGADATKFYNELSEEEKRIFFNIVRQIQIDTLAEILAFLDGAYWVEGQEEDLKLVSLDNPEEKLNEDLTDIFLNMVYEWDR